MKRKLPVILLLIFVALTLAFALIRVKKPAKSPVPEKQKTEE